jgi:hypothetical protein
MVFGVVALLWWIGLLPFGLIGNAGQVRQIGLEPGAFAAVNWSDIRAMLFWPVFAYCAAVIFQGVVLWSLPRAVRLHGLVNIAIAALVLACTAWIWLDSPLAPLLHADSVAGLVLQVRDALQHPPPKPIGPFLTLMLAFVAFGALARALHGLFQLVLGAFPADPAEA